MKRYIKATTHTPEQTKILTEICDAYNSIQDATDLKNNNLHLSDYHTLCDLCNELVDSHKVKTISSECADWFRKFGCDVSDDGYGNYVVTI